MDWLRNKMMNIWKKHRSESKDESANEVVKRKVGNGVVTRVAWAFSWPLNSEKQFYVLIETAMENWMRLRDCRAFHDCLPQNSLIDLFL